MMLLHLISPGQLLLPAIFLWLFYTDDVFAVRKPYQRSMQEMTHYEPGEAPPLLPPWYAPANLRLTPSEYETLTSPSQDGNLLEEPMWYIFYCGYLLRDFSRQEERLSTVLAALSRDEKWVGFGTEYFKIIAPLTTEWYDINDPENGAPREEQVECKVAGQSYQNSYKEAVEAHPGLDLPPGIMDCGGILDTSAERDNPRAGQQRLRFPRDSVSVKKLWQDLFSAVPLTKGTEVTYGVSDLNFLKAWHTVHQVIESLDVFLEEVLEAVDETETLDLWGANMNPVVDERPRQTRLFPREKIGYGKYFEGKFGATLLQTTDILPDPDWMDVAAELYFDELKGAPDVYVSYANIINIVLNGVLPLMMDAFADLSIKANNAARPYATWPKNLPVNLPPKYAKRLLEPHPLLSWGFPKFDDFSPLSGILEKWPEWTNNSYMAMPYPVPQEELRAAVGKMLLERDVEEDINAGNLFPWRGTVRSSTREFTGSLIYLT